jgi:UDP-N-acetylmuramoyl-L-alanyl-D-glutamate--2,6-diaminopimelate ligase
MSAERTERAASAAAPGGAPASRSLAELLAASSTACRVVRGDPQLRVASVCSDSRRVARGDLFVALAGAVADGAEFIGEACARGAAAVVVDAALPSDRLPSDERVALVTCSAPRAFVADAAAELAGHPSRRLTLVAITGTSGKTTTSYLIESIWRAAGHATGVIGTIEYRYAGRHEPASLTTPDAIELQTILARMLTAGVSHVVMEASSHALALDRLRATACDAGVLTNISRDHLDYHGDLASYRAAKERLFREVLPASGKQSFAVLNADDPHAITLAGDLTMPVVTFGGAGDVRFEQVSGDLRGSSGTLVLGDRRQPFLSSLIGAPHRANVLAASAVTWRLGAAPEVICAGIAACRGVPGRLESIDEGQPFAVIVDYAHKPDALDRTLASLRDLTRGRVVVVFGCGGDRDRGKRPLMGAIAAQRADVTILTSDNPRTEDPMAIISAIEAGVRSEGRTRVAQEALGQTGHEAVYAVVPERRAAIARAIEIARAGDLILIAGKGHEDYQIVGTAKHHLDDREEAHGALRRVGYAR